MIMLDVRTLKERIQWLLDQKHMSASELSQKAGLVRGHVGLIKSEKIKEPDEATVAKIAHAAGARASWLITGDGDPWAVETPVEAVAAATTSTAAHRATLDALVAAFRTHPSATIEDLDAVRALVTAGHARLLPPDHAPAILGAWLSAAQVIRSQGHPVTIDALSEYFALAPTPAPSRTQN